MRFYACMTLPSLAASLFVLLLVTACGSTSDKVARPGSVDSVAQQARADSTASEPAVTSPRVLGACCRPSPDSSIYALLALNEATPAFERPPELALVHYRFNSGLARREHVVVRDSATWAKLWTEIVRTHSPKPPVPSVNFTRHMLVVASMGQKSSGGYAVWIDSITVAGDTLRIAVREQSPGPRCGTTAALTAPVALARVERSQLPAVFTTVPVVSDCP